MTIKEVAQPGISCVTTLQRLLNNVFNWTLKIAACRQSNTDFSFTIHLTNLVNIRGPDSFLVYACINQSARGLLFEKIHCVGWLKQKEDGAACGKGLALQPGSAVIEHILSADALMEF